MKNIAKQAASAKLRIAGCTALLGAQAIRMASAKTAGNFLTLLHNTNDPDHLEAMHAQLHYADLPVVLENLKEDIVALRAEGGAKHGTAIRTLERFTAFLKGIPHGDPAKVLEYLEESASKGPEGPGKALERITVTLDRAISDYLKENSFGEKDEDPVVVAGEGGKAEYAPRINTAMYFMDSEQKRLAG